MSTIDTRDLLDELRDLCGGDEMNPDPENVLGWTDEDCERVNVLSELFEEISEAADGVELIPEDEFEDYARQLAEDIGALPEFHTWPTYCIDWEYAARELRHDYSSIDFDGVTYLYRS